ncbi:hypothetical protein PRIPAC_88371 [Pristionchus pacificus]|uniref:Uncharacterized protein n=1 Tax=Pristionchus pacificus TaxID=54126 RepID=A0A2A6CX33_PRIPA|nr:hypothetical protein PRIPAC_88371 [Pristionchus pacificus]|eukprot:PDM82794.1 hypothetical protein PRIPAC_37187 [Pristionchus pacificus]
MFDTEDEKGLFDVSVNPLELKEKYAKKRTQADADAIISDDYTSFGQHFLSVISNAYQFMYTMVDVGPCDKGTKKSLEQFRAIRDAASRKDNGKGWSKKHPWFTVWCCKDADPVITIEDDEVVDPATATVSEAVKPEDNDHIKVESRDVDHTGTDAVRSAYFAAASPAPMHAGNRRVDATRRTRSPGSMKPTEVKEAHDEKLNAQVPQKRKTRASSIASGNEAKKEKRQKQPDKKLAKNTVRKTSTQGQGLDKPNSAFTIPAPDKNNNDHVKQNTNRVKEETSVKKVEMFKYTCGVCSFQTPNQVVFEEHGKKCT